MADGCSFCGGEGTFRPTPMVHVCRSCALRIADLSGDPSATFWVSVASPARGSVPPSAGEAIDTAPVFEAFKEGVAKQISDQDAESHLNLAEAYREMGLFLDARREAGIAIAARAGARASMRCVCCSRRLS